MKDSIKLRQFTTSSKLNFILHCYFLLPLAWSVRKVTGILDKFPENSQMVICYMGK